ncbi:hypothetical protein CWO92_04925 [Heyndrickxia camelliae]|uniref:Uncharacterized protein n=1 Tax=Heyndrickxia camelliae TaxID=1707093 RepID=A0A2N3LP97_9BACI|nr:hypothetical protein CWO92_04925 [Heyndrickxia camelliae]
MLCPGKGQVYMVMVCLQYIYVREMKERILEEMYIQNWVTSEQKMIVAPSPSLQMKIGSFIDSIMAINQWNTNSMDDRNAS